MTYNRDQVKEISKNIHNYFIDKTWSIENVNNSQYLFRSLIKNDDINLYVYHNVINTIKQSTDNYSFYLKVDSLDSKKPAEYVSILAVNIEKDNNILLNLENLLHYLSTVKKDNSHIDYAGKILYGFNQLKLSPHDSVKSYAKIHQHFLRQPYFCVTDKGFNHFNIVDYKPNTQHDAIESVGLAEKWLEAVL